MAYSDISVNLSSDSRWAVFFDIIYVAMATKHIVKHMYVYQNVYHMHSLILKDLEETSVLFAATSKCKV